MNSYNALQILGRRRIKPAFTVYCVFQHDIERFHKYVLSLLVVSAAASFEIRPGLREASFDEFLGCYAVVVQDGFPLAFVIVHMDTGGYGFDSLQRYKANFANITTHLGKNPTLLV
jgi:hypothetical protein